VHVEKGEGSAKIWLEPNLEPKYFYEFKAQEKKKLWILQEKTMNY